MLAESCDFRAAFRAFVACGMCKRARMGYDSHRPRESGLHAERGRFEASPHRLLEFRMSKSIKALIALSLVAFVAACAQQEEAVYVEPEPVAAEPVYNKY